MQIPLLSLQGAAVQFGTVRALEPVNLTVHRGERIALVGANGSGKTTLLRLLHGLVPCTLGERHWHHAPPVLTGPAATPARRAPPPPQLAMVFQRPFLLNLSVRANVSIALWLRGVPAAQRSRSSADALERVGLGALARRPARSLSGGQQQRLALAIATAQTPDILFLDEPTASLDLGAKREVEALIAQFAAAGLTVVMSTHNLGQAKRLATRVLYLERGQIRVDKPVNSFFSDALIADAELFLKGEMPWH